MVAAAMLPLIKVWIRMQVPDVPDKVAEIKEDQIELLIRNNEDQSKGDLRADDTC